MNNRLLEKIVEIYDWLDAQIRENAGMAGRCNICGKCCNFDSYDHHLFVTQPEVMYLTAKLGSENLDCRQTSIKPMTDGICPYNVDGKCTVYEHRFAACRIFCCNGDTDFQSGLSESALGKLKSICTEFQIPYRYTDLATALNI